MNRPILFLYTIYFACLPFLSHSQCDSTNITGNLYINSDTTINGALNISGTFTIPSGITVTVDPFSSGSCGELKIYAGRIFIEGTINGNQAGYEGGQGGLGGSVVSSPTGDASGITGCSNSGDPGQIVVEAGKGGDDGQGNGAGDGANM